MADALLCCSFWGANGADLRALDDADSIDLAATAVQCTVCHCECSASWNAPCLTLTPPSANLQQPSAAHLRPCYGQAL
jgi:hypothetical protein